jgi:hypothetical protein
MKNAMFAALLLAAPAAAFAQAQPNNSMSQPIPNQTNLQDQANGQQQPRNAHRVTGGAGLGQANSVPTPTLHNQNSPVR